MKIVMMEPIGIGQGSLKRLVSPFEKAGHTFVSYDSRETDPEKLAKRIQDAQVLILANQPLREEVLRHCQDLKMVSIGFTGWDHVDAVSYTHLDVYKRQGVSFGFCHRRRLYYV